MDSPKSQILNRHIKMDLGMRKTVPLLLISPPTGGEDDLQDDASRGEGGTVAAVMLGIHGAEAGAKMGVVSTKHRSDEGLHRGLLLTVKVDS